MLSRGKMTTMAYHEQLLSIVDAFTTVSSSVGAGPETEAMAAKEKGTHLAVLTCADKMEA
jgi:hypothetical protein